MQPEIKCPYGEISSQRSSPSGYFLELCGMRALQGNVKVCSKIVGVPLNDLSHLSNVRSVKKAQSLLGDPSHRVFKANMQDKQAGKLMCPCCYRVVK